MVEIVCINTSHIAFKRGESVRLVGAGMNGKRITARGIDQLRCELSGRDLAILGQVADLRLMSARQIEAIHFPRTEYTALSAARVSRKALARLERDCLLVRVERRIGGVRAGSASFVYALGFRGHRLLALDGKVLRVYEEPSTRLIDHTLAIGDLVVGLTLAARAGRCQILNLQPEPRCWRDFSGIGGRQWLKPDLFVAVGIGEFEDRYFVEVDRGTVHIPSLIRKCRIYDSYYRTGAEQAKYAVFPKVCVIVTSPERRKLLSKTIAGTRNLNRDLFVVVTTDAAINLLTGGMS